MGLEELAALVLQVGASGGQGADVVGFVGLDVLQFGQQVAFDVLAVLVREVDLLVELGDLVFHLLDEDGAEGAVVGAVSAGADEVGVDGPAAVLGVLDQQAGAAQAAGDGGLEVVVVDALSFAVAVGVQDVLDFLPGGGIDQGLVASGVFDSLEGDNALVVGVAQQGVQSSFGDGLGRLGGGGGRSSPRPARCVASCDTVQLPVAYSVKARRIRGARSSSRATVRISRPCSSLARTLT